MTQVIIKPATAANVRRLLQAALNHELKVLQIGIEKTMRRLKDFEERFNQETATFYQQFQAGELGDSIDYIKWAGEHETLLQLQKDFQELSETQLC
ncbi:MAG: hypothetical protein JW981_06415 [Anaerolineae bacterium]|nr:hypothetical protein [Anaerolineae bacterium]